MFKLSFFSLIFKVLVIEVAAAVVVVIEVEVAIIVDIEIHLDTVADLVVAVVIVVVIIIVAVHHHPIVHIHHQEVDEGDIHLHRLDFQDLVHVHFPLVSIHLNVQAEFLCQAMLEISFNTNNR